MTLQAVIFDMDGVLTDTVAYHYQSWKRVTEEFGLPFRPEDNRKLLGLTRRASLEVILAGRVLPEAEMERLLHLKNAYYLEYVQHMTEADRLPGVKALLEDLRANHIRVGVASGSSNTRVVLEKIGVAPLIQAVVDANQIRQSKPAPDAFLAAAQALRAPTSNCLVIEDSPAGIEAALAAGMCPLAVDPEMGASRAFRVVASLRELSTVHLKAIFDQWQNAERSQQLGQNYPILC